MYLRFAWRYFKSKKSANAINIIAWVTVGVIAFATCCQVLVLSVFNGFEDLVKSLYSSFYTDIKVVPAKGKTFTLQPSQIDAIHKQAGVAYASLIAEEKALLKNGEAQTVIYLKGVDDDYARVSGVPEKVTRGKYFTGTPEAPTLVSGTGIHNAAGMSLSPLEPGDTPTIILPRRGISGADLLESISEGHVQPAGVFAIQQEFDDKYAITNIGFVKAQLGLGADEYSAVEIKLSEKADPKQVQKTLQSLLGKEYNVFTRYEQNRSLYATMQLEKLAIYGVFTLILIIVAFNMVSALTMLVLEKKKDISVLQSMGAGRSMILKIFLSEGLLLGGIGSAIGIVLAAIICVLQLKFKLVKIEGGSFLLDYFPVKMMASDFLFVALIAAFIAFAAAWFPARKASRQAFELR